MTKLPATIVVLTTALAALALPARGAEDRVLADFEGKDYGDWKAEGSAFGAGPARATLANQQAVSGFQGQGLVNSYLGGDGSKGRLTSPAFAVDRRYLNFLIGGGHRPGEACVEFVVDGKVVRSETGADDEKLEWATWDLGEYAGRSAVIRIVDQATGGWGHVNADQFVLSDAAKSPARTWAVIRTDVVYDETYRPQFHFTSKQGWLNDPNGLVFYNGEYHLFFQHNPLGNVWGNMTWGHAVSRDLVRWRQLPNALERDALGDMFSGSAVVDVRNTAGFGAGAMALLYTAAGDQGPMNKGKPFTQCLAWSTDGRTFHKYDRNPVIGQVGEDSRDPKVFWHEPTKRWVMALYVPVKEGGKKVDTVQFFGSADLRAWEFLSRLDDLYECPDLFELPVDGQPGKTKWVLFGADGTYWLGAFDGRRFTPDGPKVRSDWGKNFYAAQTYSDIPASDGRRILVGWMRDGKYPGMPFNQQMSFPTELTLRSTPGGVRLCKWPVKEIETLVVATHRVPAGELKPGDDPLKGLSGELYDVDAVIDVGDAKSIAFDIAGTRVAWSNDGRLEVGGARATAKPVDGRVALRLLVDRTSIEVFANRGDVTVSQCYLPRGSRRAPALSVEGGAAKVVSLEARELRPAWRE